MARFWVYVGDKIQGPVDIPSLRKVTGFNLLTQVCEEGEQTWRMADEVIEIKSYFLSPPRPNSFALDAGGNTAPKLEPPPKIEPSAKPILEELILPEPNTSFMGQAGAPAAQTGSPALRTVCEICGYKNPRDVVVCMKCGETLKPNAAPSKMSSPSASVGDRLKKPDGFPPKAAGMTTVLEPTPVSAAPVVAAPAAVDPVAGTMVEISMSKLLIGTAVAAAILAGSFLGYRSWKRKHTVRTAPVAPAAVSDEEPPSRRAKRYTRRRTVRRVSSSEAAALPGVTRGTNPPPQAPSSDDSVQAAPYRVIAEATPLQKRYSSPITSPYATKRRANQGLWATQEDHAIQQVQRTRIYGGQRTIDRNVEILMQILRDREYTTAFESGKRIYLYNDVDWSAVDKEGPVYEVHLTFSGGRETDGNSKKPLHFAFLSDLERGTVEPGGEDQIHSNTLHAFFDESRIPPEDRRPIAKDTEELVLAAQPGASPLALDTVVRQFAKVYTTDALSRVAAAYGLSEVQKKIAHDPRLGSDDPSPMAAGESQKPILASEMKAPASKSAADVKPDGGTKFVNPFAKGSGADFRMDSGAGRERTFLVRATSHASVDRIWEVLTGYDQLRQFIPDMLTSEREGQDGAATIVHAVYLTRFMIFVFKVNLHLRVIEHPHEHSLDFERIAGEFDSFRGSVEVTTDPATHESQIIFHATVVPTGHTPNWVMEGMGRRLLVPQMEAIRAKAETN